MDARPDSFKVNRVRGVSRIREKWAALRGSSPEDGQSFHHDVSFGSLDTLQILDLVDSQLMQTSLVKSFGVGKQVRHSPASISMLHSRHAADAFHHLTDLSWSHADEDIRSHNLPLPAVCASDFRTSTAQPGECESSMRKCSDANACDFALGTRSDQYADLLQQKPVKAFISHRKENVISLRPR
jgi:hypothetical protein